MNRTSLLKDFSNKIFKYRESSGYSNKKMAAYFGVAPVNYTRYEQAIIFPNFGALYSFAIKTGISLDWLVCGKGPMYFEEKMEKEEKEEKAASEEKEVTSKKKGEQTELIGTMMDDEIKELVEHMERIPLLRHEILVSFYKFKEKNKKNE